MFDCALDVGGSGAARRRRDRRLRVHWRHEQLSLRMLRASVGHHSWQSKTSVGVQADGLPALAPVVEYATPAVTCAVPAPLVGCVAPAPAVAYAAPAPVIGYVAPAPSVTYAAPAPVFEYVTPAPVLEYIAPAPAGSFVAPSQQLRPAYSAAAVITGVNLDADFVGSASQVVGSLPHGEVFAAPVFHQVHQVPLAGGKIPENLVEIPVVPEQVDFLRVVARRPPPLVDVMPSSRAHRHFMEDLGELAPSVQLLDLPVPQMVENVTDTLLRILDFPIAEQVVEVLKISCSPCPSRSRFLSRSQRISWWKCRLFCLPRASLCRSRSRSLTLQCTFPSLSSGSSFVMKPRPDLISGTDVLARRSGSRRRASESSGLE